MILPFSPDSDGHESVHTRLVLVGPPGTGKTTAMLRAWLEPLVRDEVPVLATSFTKASAMEIRERLSAATGRTTHDLRHVVKTIHSEALRLATESHGHLKVYGSKRVLTDEDDDATGSDWLAEVQEERRKEALRVWEYARATMVEAPTLGRVVAETMDAMPNRGRWPEHEIAAEIQSYEDEKKVDGSIDFTDMLTLARGVPAPRRAFVLVDEAQDLSPLQLSLVNAWGRRARCLVLIGDPDQGIYSFTGADGSYLTKQIRDGVEARSLTRSHRVPRAAHTLARRLILENEDRVDAPYAPAERNGIVTHTSWHSDAVEAAREYIDADENHTAFVLGRSAFALERYVDVLRSEGIPFASERGKGSPLGRGIAVAVVTALGELRATGRVALDDAVRLADALPAKYFAPKETVRTREKIRMLSMEHPSDTVDVKTLASYGMHIDSLVEAPTLEAAAGLLHVKDLSDLFRIVDRYGMAALRAPPRLTLTTFHTSKGREAGLVVVDLTCTKKSRVEIYTSDAGRESERRALYVALTRTKDRMILVQGRGSDLGAVLGADLR